MRYPHYLLLFSLVPFLNSCTKNPQSYDATGTFEATEVIVSSEVNGKILAFDAKEGDQLEAGVSVAIIDVLDLELEKIKIQASIDALSLKNSDPGPQIDVLKEQRKSVEAQIGTQLKQLDVLVIEQNRIQKLFESNAATRQTLDDISGKVEVQEKLIESTKTQKSIIDAQIEAAKRNVAIQNRGINSERDPMLKQRDLIDYRLEKANILNPISGTILTKYAEKGEFATVGKPLYKIADLSAMTLRAYITGDQLGQIKIGQQVNVFIDQGKDEYKKYDGRIKWIADEAEFTPKTIQTKNERANLVYAVKAAVENDGFLKIGMYGEISFDIQGDNEEQH